MALLSTTASSVGAKTIAEGLNKSDAQFRISGDAAYATGGSVLPTGVLPVGAGFYGVVENISGNITRKYVWNSDTQKLMAFVHLTGAEVAAAVDLSADRILFKGVAI